MPKLSKAQARLLREVLESPHHEVPTPYGLARLRQWEQTARVLHRLGLVHRFDGVMLTDKGRAAIVNGILDEAPRKLRRFR